MGNINVIIFIYFWVGAGFFLHYFGGWYELKVLGVVLSLSKS